MELTTEQIVERYGDIELEFDYYYKYTFYFRYADRNVNIIGTMGGYHSEIYRESVTSRTKKKVLLLSEYWSTLTITEDNSNRPKTETHLDFNRINVFGFGF